MVCIDIFLTNLRIFLSWRTFSHFLTFFSEKAQHNFIKTRGGGGGSTAVYKTYKKTDVFFRDDVPNLSKRCRTSNTRTASEKTRLWWYPPPLQFARPWPCQAFLSQELCLSARHQGSPQQSGKRPGEGTTVSQSPAWKSFNCIQLPRLPTPHALHCSTASPLCRPPSPPPT